MKEESPEAREMPEALMRLGELYWETRARAVRGALQGVGEEARPISAAPSPSRTSSALARLFARVLKDYPWFESYDLALYVDGFLATEQGKQDEALGAVQSHPHRVSRQPRSSPTRTWRAPKRSSTASTTTPGRSSNTRR